MDTKSENAGPEFATFVSDPDYSAGYSISYASFKQPEFSKWQCYLFGSDDGSGIVWRPREGQEPNWFWRWMQYLAFGNRWRRDD